MSIEMSIEDFKDMNKVSALLKSVESTLRKEVESEADYLNSINRVTNMQGIEMDGLSWRSLEK
jgi:hypothetical protein